MQNDSIHVPDAVAEQGRRIIDLLEAHYRSGHHDLGKAFFIPCLRYCSRYRRAVGFFSSSSFVTWAEILPALVRSDCTTTIQLLLSPVLSPQDRATLLSVETEDQRAKIFQALGDKIIEDALAFAESAGGDSSTRHRLLAWMIASGKLEVRFAFARHVDSAGLFHEKIGVFEFPWGSRVAFTGSANETLSGYSSNYETIDVFRDWIADDAPRVRVKENQFAEAWDGRAPGLIVLGLSQAVMMRIKERAEESPSPFQPTDSPVKASNRWRHQDEAIEVFLTKERGILEMATGTGKTRTALNICKSLIERDLVSSIIVTTDGTDLLDQWTRQLLALAQETPTPWSIARHYADHHERDRFASDPLHRILLASRPAIAPALRALNKAAGAKSLVIHDEVHRLGSPGNRRDLAGLADHIRYRLGLSATPDREYDTDGNTFICDNIGPVIYTFGLEDAIGRGILSPFNYYPIQYTPDDNDRARILGVRRRAAASEAAGTPMSKEEIWIALANVYKTSLAKLPLFDTFISSHPHLLTRCIVFVENRDYGDDVLELIHKYRHDFHTYYASEDSEVLRHFASGEFECLLTCHRLSEGIDIRNLETVILFSSARARLETIQRMGRCLRADPTNPAKRANVVDFIRTSDPRLDDVTADDARLNWLTALSRIRPTETMDGH